MATVLAPVKGNRKHAPGTRLIGELPATRPLATGRIARDGASAGALAGTARLAAVAGRAPANDGGPVSKAGNAVKKGAKAVGASVAKGANKVVAGAKAVVKFVTRSPGKLDSRRIERDPADSNQSTIKTRKEAKQALEAGKTAATSRYEALSKADRARYDRLKKAVAGDIEGEAALQKLLVESKLPGSAALGGNKKSLLAQLDTMASQKLAKGIDRRALVADTIQEVADPTCINQKSKGTCVATTATILLVRNNPAEYARLVAGLATPGGKVKTAKGDSIAREADWQAKDGNRSTSVRLLQPALMELGNGKKNYDNTKDKHSGGGSGLDSKGAERILDSVTGRDYGRTDISSQKVSKKDLDKAFKDLQKALSSGQSVPVALYWMKGGHAVLATKIAKGRVHFVNPWGQEESLTISEFKNRLKSFHAAKK